MLNNTYTYDFEVETMVTVFMNALSEIVVKRFKENKLSEDRIIPRVVYAPKQRVLADLLDKDQNIQLPVLAVSIGGITRDQNRVFNKNLGTFQSGSNIGRVAKEFTPLPIDLNIKVSIATTYQKDMDQIISHIIPYINPYFVVSWTTPARNAFEIRSNVFWDGNVAITYPNDITATTSARVLADLSFTFKGWMFQAVPQETIGTIFTIHTDYSLAYTGMPPEYLLNSTYQVDTPISDYRKIVGSPPQPHVVEPYTGNVGVYQQFNVYGAGFTKINNVYLSGAPFASVSTLQNPFSALSAYPAFNALKLDPSTWQANNDNLVTFVMPSADRTGFVDVIVEGPYGYGSLTKSVRVNTYNPFPIKSSQYSKFVPYQAPYSKGIQIF